MRSVKRKVLSTFEYKTQDSERRRSPCLASRKLVGGDCLKQRCAFLVSEVLKLRECKEKARNGKREGGKGVVSKHD